MFKMEEQTKNLTEEELEKIIQDETEKMVFPKKRLKMWKIF